MRLASELQQEMLSISEYNELKSRVHEELINILDLSLIDTLDKDILRREIKKIIEELLSKQRTVLPLNADEKEQFCREVADEVFGLGPIEPFMHDPTVTDILVNGSDHIYVERKGRLHRTTAHFKDNTHLKKIIDRIVSAVGRRIDESCPMVDARLADGSRVNAIVPPLAIDGPSLSIRRFGADPLELEDLISLSALPVEAGELLKGMVRAKLNILISGGTGAGKTTLLNVFSRFIPEDQRIVTIEDSAELQLKQDHVVRLETRPANIEGRGEITQRELVKNSLRMRPDRIVVGEVRSGEVVDMLQAMNTGHDGSLTTIHANSPRDALLRLETLVAMAGLNIPNEAVRRYIASAINVIVQVARLIDGSRKLISMQEIVGMEGNVVTTQELFSYEQTGIDSHGRSKGAFRFHGVLPRFTEKFKALGVPVPYELFQPGAGKLTHGRER
jgi:pilus assembly protein CpaF